MLRNLFYLVFAVAIGMGATAQAASLQDEHILPTSGDRWTPWPWSSSMPFPWSDVEGSWRVSQGEFVSYFALRIIQPRSPATPQLVVRQYDGDTCKLLSKGVGLERNKRIYAQMTSRGGTIYRVHFTAFDEKDSPQPPLRGNYPTQAVMVVSMGPLDHVSAHDMTHMQIVKVSQLMTQEGCREDLTGRK